MIKLHHIALLIALSNASFNCHSTQFVFENNVVTILKKIHERLSVIPTMVNDGSYWTPNYAEPTIAELAYRLDEAGITDVSSSLYYLNSILAKKADINYNLHRVLSIISVLDPAIIFQIKIRSPSQPQGS